MKAVAEILWGDRFLWIKALLALLFLTGLSRLSYRMLSNLHPKVDAMRMAPQEFQGYAVSIAPNSVHRGGEGEFQILEGGVPIRVVAPGRWNKGDWVHVRGTFRGESVVADIARPIPGYPVKRAIMYGCSIALVGVVAWLFFRQARPSLERGLFVSRY